MKGKKARVRIAAVALCLASVIWPVWPTAQAGGTLVIVNDINTPAPNEEAQEVSVTEILPMPSVIVPIDPQEGVNHPDIVTLPDDDAPTDGGQMPASPDLVEIPPPFDERDVSASIGPYERPVASAGSGMHLRLPVMITYRGLTYASNADAPLSSILAAGGGDAGLVDQTITDLLAWLRVAINTDVLGSLPFTVDAQGGTGIVIENGVNHGYADMGMHVAPDAAPGEYEIPIAITWQGSAPGATAQKTEGFLTVAVVSRADDMLAAAPGVTEFFSIPVQLALKTIPLSVKDQLIPRADDGWALVVRSTESHSFKLYASVASQLASGETGDVLPDSIVFVDENGVHSLSNGDVLIASGEANDGIDLYSISWAKDKGLMGRLAAFRGLTGHTYWGDITFTLVDGP